MLLFDDFVQRFGQGPPGDRAFRPIISSLVVSLMSIGTLLGALSASYTADWWGRRRSLSFGVMMFCIGNIIQITAMSSWVHLMMGRFIAGLGVGVYRAFFNLSSTFTDAIHHRTSHSC